MIVNVTTTTVLYAILKGCTDLNGMHACVKQFNLNFWLDVTVKSCLGNACFLFVNKTDVMVVGGRWCS